MAEDRRQFDVGHEERMLARSDLQKKEQDRQALFKGYGNRGAGADTGTGQEGVYEIRQGESLAGVEGGAPLTTPQGEVVLEENMEALA